MSNTELIRELRALTSAGMKDCKDALEESNWDLQKAVDIVKVKGLNIADGRTGRVASEGRIALGIDQTVFASGPTLSSGSIVEVNCQTDFVANSEEFRNFTGNVLLGLKVASITEKPFTADIVEAGRKEAVSKTKENIVVRRWHTEAPQNPLARVFAYQHSNAKIGVLITLLASNEAVASSPEFTALGEELAMQIAAMNPLAVDADRLSADERDRQRAIFETQLKEEKKPEKMWEKIIEGKFRKWNAEVCLLEQESVVVPKTTVKQVMKNVGTKLGGEIQVLGFTRYQVGEGIEKKKENLAEEVAKLM
jgi:elongation factor Ts